LGGVSSDVGTDAQGIHKGYIMSSRTYLVNTELTSYLEMRSRWTLTQALLGGTAAMRIAGEKFLPRSLGETTEAWTRRINRSFLLNGFERTIESMVGKIFSKPILLKPDVPQQLRDWWEDIDLEGHNGDVFFKEVATDAMEKGLSHVLVDMPTTPPGLTLKEEQDLGIRPYLVHITAKQLIGWRSEKINGIQTLTQVRFNDDYMAADGEYGEKLVNRVRVIYRDRWENHELRGDDWLMVDTGPWTLGTISLTTFYTKRTGFMTAKPPLENLAYKNLEHWQSASDQRNILHYARMPILFGKGLADLDEGDVEIGPDRLISGPNDSDLKYVEHTGAAINSGRQDLKDIEDHMRLMGLEMLMPMAGGGQTATAKSLDYADINSPLQFMASSLGDTIETTFMFMAKWAKLTSSGSVKVNTDFGITLRDAADVQALIQARLAQEISADTFWTEMKRRNILSDDFDPVAEKILLSAEPPKEAAHNPGIGDDVIGAGNDKP
jgi:hypothetical protein